MITLHGNVGAPGPEIQVKTFASTKAQPFGRKLVHFGKFKGRQDTRGLRCIKQQCKAHEYGRCIYCKSLPYIPSRLAWEQVSSLTSPGAIKNPITAAREIEVFGVQGLMAMASNKQRANSNVRTKTFVNSQPLIRARFHLARLKSRTWTSEVKSHIENDNSKKATAKYSCLGLMSKKQTNSSSHL